MIMGILEKIKRKKEQRVKQSKTKVKPKQNVEQDLDKMYTKLTNEEIKYLITLISKSEFIGKDLQILYSIVAKLQNKLNL